MRNRYSTTLLLCLLGAGASVPTAHAGADTPAARAAQTPEARAGLPEGALSPATGSPQRRAAEQGLAVLARRLPASAPAAGSSRVFDVDDYRVLRDATLGEGFEIYLVDPHALLAGKRLDQSLYGSGEWRFVVMAHGKAVGLVTVARMNGTWSMVEAGASELAAEVASVAARYENTTPPPRLRFVRSLQAVADFIEVSAQNTSTAAAAPPGEAYYIPLLSARSLLGRAQERGESTSPERALRGPEVEAVLRAGVQRGLSDPTFAH